MSESDPDSSKPTVSTALGSEKVTRPTDTAVEPTSEGAPNEADAVGPIQAQDHLAAYLQAELQEMAAAWRGLVKKEPFCPCWTWREVQEALLDLTETPVEELVIRGALSALMKQASFKPQELVLAELIRLIRAGHDLVLQRSARAMLEVEMS